MTILSAVTEIVGDLFIFVGAMAVLLVVLVIVISRLPADNPLKRMLVALSWRVAATLGAGLVAIPVEPIPGVDAVYDIAVPVALAIYWLSFFWSALRPQPAKK
jgi:hypothetical protein